jgi:hypothetical protein
LHKAFPIEIPPNWIAAFDQIKLPRAPPFLEGFLAANRGIHRIVPFKPHKVVDSAIP